MRRDSAEHVELKKMLILAEEEGDENPVEKKLLQNEDRELEERIARTEREKDGVALMLMETRLMLRSLEFHVKQMGEKKNDS